MIIIKSHYYFFLLLLNILFVFLYIIYTILFRQHLRGQVVDQHQSLSYYHLCWLSLEEMLKVVKYWRRTRGVLAPVSAHARTLSSPPNIS
jgi:hypothetical protein